MKYFAIFFILTLFCSVTFCQTTLNESDVTALVGKIYTQTSFADTNDDAAITALVAKSGTGQTWDLSALHNYNSSSTASFILQEGTVGAKDGGEQAFHAATHVIRLLYTTGLNGTAYNFIIINSYGYQDIGTYTDAPPSSSTITYNPPLLVYPFPLHYGSKWSSTPSEKVGGQTLKLTYNDEVDGDGTLIVPGGSAKALRVKETIITDYGIPGYGDTSTTYRFVDPTGTINGTLAAPTTKSLGPFTQNIKGTATYSVHDGQVTGKVSSNDNTSVSADQNFPNPFSTVTQIPYSLNSSGLVHCSVYDVLGRELQNIDLEIISSGKHTFTIDGSKLPEGNYYYTLIFGTGRITKQMTIVR